MRKTSIAAAVLALFALMTACNGESEAGEACDAPGATVDVCEPGTVCGRPSSKTDALVCIFTCSDGKDCPRDYDCKGVEGTSIKGCRFKD